MKKKIIRFCVMIVMIISFMPISNVVFAQNPNQNNSEEFFEKAGDWFRGVQQEGENNVSPISIDVVNSFMDIVNYVGTVIIIIATMFLGVKYMFGSVDGKSEVKESLVTLLIACVFFFGWQYIRDIVLMSNGTELFISPDQNESYKALFGRLLGVVTMVVNLSCRCKT